MSDQLTVAGAAITIVEEEQEREGPQIMVAGTIVEPGMTEEQVMNMADVLNMSKEEKESLLYEFIRVTRKEKEENGGDQQQQHQGGGGDQGTPFGGGGGGGDDQGDDDTEFSNYIGDDYNDPLVAGGATEY